MHRRAFLAATAGGVGLAGCLSPIVEDPSAPTDSPTKSRSSGTPVRRTATGVEATFRIVAAHEPTEATAEASFDGTRVVVEGTMDPEGCREPTLAAVRYDASNGAVRLDVETESRYGPTATIECANASFDYRSVVSVETGTPTVVELVHDHHEREDRTFTLERR